MRRLASCSSPAGSSCLTELPTQHALPRVFTQPPPQPRACAAPAAALALVSISHEKFAGWGHPTWSLRRTVRAHGTWPGASYAGLPPSRGKIETPQEQAAIPVEGLPYGGGGSRGDPSPSPPPMPGPNGALTKADYPKFVHFFRQAGPYIAGHRAKTFVIVVPGHVVADRKLLKSAMSDVALLHGLGVRLVVVAGAQNQIDHLLQDRGLSPAYVGGYRVTDKDALKVAMEAGGQVRTTCEQILSKGPAIPMIRRHTKGDGEIHFEPALRVISGNFVAAKRRGVIDGVDFGYTGEVRFVLADDIERQLEGGNLVLLSNLGFTAAGEVLNCNTYDVGLHAAIELGADKLFVLHLDEVSELGLPPWLPLSDAQALLIRRLEASLSSEQVAALRDAMEAEEGSPPPWTPYPSSPRNAPEQASMHAASRVATRLANKQHADLVVDLDVWHTSGLPAAVGTCVVACCKGIKRAHLLDARLDGGLLLELYSRDGVGTMISTDFYEGIRRAGPGDLDAIAALLRPLEDAGTLVRRTREELSNMLLDFTVVERENKLLGCALLLPLGEDEEGVNVAELGAFCIDPAFRGSGRGDSLLDYVEQDARKRGVQRLVLLTTRTADWFEQRDFKWIGPAYSSTLLPERRRVRINPSRNSQLYAKHMEAPDEGLKEPGKRIGF